MSLRSRLRNSDLGRWLYFQLRVDIIRGRKVVDETMDECFDKFLKKGEFSEKQLNQIRKDIRKCYWKYYSTPDEYFLFDFMNKSHSERKEFLTDRFLWRTLWTTWGGNLLIMKVN